MSAKSELIETARQLIADAKTDDWRGFSQVDYGEPPAVPVDRYACLWWAEEDASENTLGNRMYTERWPFRAYFRLTDMTPEERKRQELEMVHAKDAVQDTLWGAENLDNGKGMSITSGDARSEPYDFTYENGQSFSFRVLAFDLTVEDLEGSEINR